MYRDKQLLLKILKTVLKSETNPTAIEPSSFPETDAEQFRYHVMLLADDNLITIHAGGMTGFFAVSLTNQGHDYLDCH